MSKKRKSTKDARWAEAKQKCRLNADTVRMAKELGLNPRSLIKNIPSKAQAWKAPVHVWIREMYEKRRMKAAMKQPVAGKRRADAQPPANRIPPATEKCHSGGTPRDRDEYLGGQALNLVSGQRPDHDVGDNEIPF